jgi:transposase
VSTVELLVARCAGLDVAKDEVVACVRVPDGRGGRAQQVRTFQTFTSGLEALAGWLAAEGVVQVVMEATGQLLEAGLVGAGGGRLPAAAGQRPPRQDPAGRKTDVCDAAWLARAAGARAAAGQLRAPGPDPRAARPRPATASGPFQAHASEGQRIQKTLEDAGIKLDSVAAEVLGVSGRAMLAALVAGERDPGVLAELARAGCAPSSRSCARRYGAVFVATTRCWFVWPWRTSGQLEASIAELDTHIDRVLAPFAVARDRLDTITGWASGRPSACSPRSGWTCRCSPPPRTWRRGRAAARATT